MSGSEEAKLQPAPISCSELRGRAPFAHRQQQPHTQHFLRISFSSLKNQYPTECSDSRSNRCRQNLRFHGTWKPSVPLGYNTIFVAIHELIEKHGVARTEGSYLRLRDRLIKTQCLILDDPGIKKPSASVVQDLCDILKERFSTRSKIITSQIPIENWKEVITDHCFAPKEKITGVEFAALVRQRGFTGRVLFASNGEFDSEKLSGIVDKIVDKQPAEWDVLKS